MPKITDYPALSSAPQTDDLLVIVDVHDTSESAQGTTKKIPSGQFALAVAGGVELAYSFNSGASPSVNLANGNVQFLTLTANATVSLTGAVAGRACAVALYLIQDATGSRSVSWPGSVIWPAATAPVLSTAAGKVDLVILESIDGGATWYGNLAFNGTTGSGGGGGGAPSGAAGGDLGGSYPNPQVTATHLASPLPPGQGGTGSATRNWAGLLTPTAVKTGSYALAAGDYVPCDTTSGTVALTLPTTPANLTVCGAKMVTQGGSNTVTLTCGGSDVFNKTSGATSVTLSLLGQGVLLQYSASAGIWYVLSDDLALAQLDTRYAAALPLSTVGDLLYENATPAPARLAGNTTAAKQFLTQTGTGSVSAAPAWGAIVKGDLAGLLTTYLQSASGVTPSATLNTLGSTVTISVDSGYTGFIPLLATTSSTGAGTENITVNLVTTYSDNSTSTNTSWTTFTLTGANLSSSSAGVNVLLAASGTSPDGKIVKSLGFSIKSSINSSTVSLTFKILGLNLP